MWKQKYNTSNKSELIKLHQKLKLYMNPWKKKLGDISRQVTKITAIKLYKYEIIHENSKNIPEEK